MNLLLKSILILFVLFPNSLFAQSNSDKSIDKLELNITELMINGNDISDSLKTVGISNGVWLEYNKQEKLIGKAQLIKNSNGEIHVKWISALNGAKKDAVTIYKFKKEGTTYTFDIYYEDKKQGYFVGEVK